MKISRDVIELNAKTNVDIKNAPNLFCDPARSI